MPPTSWPDRARPARRRPALPEILGHEPLGALDKDRHRAGGLILAEKRRHRIQRPDRIVSRADAADRDRPARGGLFAAGGGVGRRRIRRPFASSSATILRAWSSAEISVSNAGAPSVPFVPRIAASTWRSAVRRPRGRPPAGKSGLRGGGQRRVDVGFTRGSPSDSVGACAPVAISKCRSENAPSWGLATIGWRRTASTIAIRSAKQLSAFRRRMASSSTSGYSLSGNPSNHLDATPSTSQNPASPWVRRAAAARWASNRRSGSARALPAPCRGYPASPCRRRAAPSGRIRGIRQTTQVTGCPPDFPPPDCPD